MASLTAAAPPVEEFPFYRRAGFWGVAGFFSLMLLFALFAALGWPGQADSCTLPGGNCYCERIPREEVPIKQVVNTWTGLFAAAAGLAILGLTDRDRASKLPAANPMTGGGFYPIMYGALTAFLGPGAMWFHASITRFGGWLDNMSMVLYTSFLLLYDATRIFRWNASVLVFTLIFAGVNVLAGAFVWAVDGSGKYVFGAFAGIALIVQTVIILGKPRGLSRTFTPWLLSGVIAFAVAVPFWILSWTGMPLCAPTSPLQGHGLWHILAMAATPFFIFFYLRTETRPEPA